MKPEPFALERYFAAHEFTAPYLLCSSDCESWSVAELLALEHGSPEKLLALRLGYTESVGHPALREGIARLYETLTPENILVFSGAEEAIFAYYNVLLSPGDEVVVQTPCYESLASLPRALGAKVTAWEANEKEGWAIDPSFPTRDARAIVVNFPHNPTGYLMPRESFEALCALARRTGASLFSDEVYRGLEYRREDRLPAACDAYEKAVSLGVMSKSFGLAGLRIGWIATRDTELLAKLAAFKDYTTICNSAPSELLAAIALRHRDYIVGRNLGIISENLALLDRFFAKHAGLVSWQRPRAGCIAFPRVEESAAALCEEARSKAGALLAPAELFRHGDRHFRIGFGRRNFPDALARLDAIFSARAT